MVEIDAEYGSGGGQVLRTAVGLSALTGKPCSFSPIEISDKGELIALRGYCEDAPKWGRSLFHLIRVQGRDPIPRSTQPRRDVCRML